MQLIIQSYLKTFLKHWVSTLGTLLFIIMLACVVLGLMSTPLQLQLKTEWAKTHSTSYDWEVNTSEIVYSESFAFDYFILNGYNYTEPTDEHSDYLINPWKTEGQTINPNDFANFLNQIKTGTATDATLNNVLLSPSFYLFVDQWANNYTSGRVPPGLTGIPWWHYLEEYSNTDRIPAERLYLRNFLVDLAKFIDTATKWADSSASTTYTYNLNDTNGVTDATSIAKYFVNDLTSNVTLKLKDDSNWFTSQQQLYLYNAFLSANSLPKINSAQEWDPTAVTSALISQANQSKSITGLAVEIFNSQFRQIIVDDYLNNVNAYLIATALTTIANPNASENAKERYQVQSKLAYTLSEIIPGSFTPSFSTNVRAIGNKDTYNHILLDQGREPAYEPEANLREIVVSPSFLKKNKLRIGSTITLPKAVFADDIDKNDTESQNVAGTNDNNVNVFTIVGTGFAYDEIIPGSAYWSFLQPLKNYTYSYLPNNYINNYQKAAFLYYRGSVRSNPISIDSKVKNLIGNQNPYEALIWSDGPDFSQNYAMFSEPTTLVTPFRKIPTISGLNTIKIQLIIYISLGLVSLVLAFIFINFIIKKEINETRRQLGIFKSFGYGIAELSLIFATKTLITIVVGIVIGWICSIPLQFFMAKNFTDSVMFNYQRLYISAGLLVTLFVGIPLLFTLVSYILTLSYLREPALLLINNRQKMPRHKPHNGVISRTLEKHDKGFRYRLSSSFVKTAIGKFVVVQLLFGFSALLYTLIFGARTVMYQVINQGFNQIHEKTDHEYAWENRNKLIIDETTGGLYNLENIDSWNDNKINYYNYKGYDTPVSAMADQNNPDNNQFNLSRYSFRTFFDALSNSVVKRPITALDLNDWWLMPQTIALERYAEGHSWSPDIKTQNYYLYKTLLFKGTSYTQNSALNTEVENMRNSNQPYNGDLTSGIFTDSWITDSWTSPTLLDDLKTTFLGIISQDKTAEQKTNNFFLTDLSRLFSMVLAESYITEQLQIEMQKLNGGTEAERYPEAIVVQALDNVARVAYAPNGKLAKFDPRDSTYWGFTEKNPLIEGVGRVNTFQDNDFDINEIFKNIQGLSFNLMAVAMIAKEAKSMINEPVINFNNFLYNSEKEQLQLQLEMTPENREWGKTNILLSDFTPNSPYGSPDTVYNFDGVTEGQWAQMVNKPGAPDEAYFNGIMPYAIAKLHNVKVGDTVQLLTKTAIPVPIKIQVIAINKSVTLPINIAWQINVDYNTFAKTMFTQQLKDAIGFSPTQTLSNYYFNGLISQNPMAEGNIKVLGIGESLSTIRFVGNQLTISLAKDKMAFASVWQLIIDYAIEAINQNPDIPEFIKEQIRQKANEIRSSINDSKASLVTNPMVLNEAGSDNTLVSMPYNLVRVGAQDFANTMNQLMTVFLLLQSVLLTITLIVVMNIVVDEAAVIILTLRSLGYSRNEVSWIIMGPYVFWVIISFFIAYVISTVAWRLLLTYAQNRWDLIIHFRFSIMDLVVPFCVLAVIMLIGWAASDYSVHRRPLTQITDGS